MHSRAVFSATILWSIALAQVDIPIPSEDAAGLESLIQGIIPTEYKSLIPSVSHNLFNCFDKAHSLTIITQETKVIDDIAAYVTSITAQPEFTSAVAALETAVPATAVAAIAESPEDFIMELATGTVPSWFTDIPSSIVDYIESIGEQALSLVESDTGISTIPGDLVSEVEASATAIYGGYPTGGYPYPYPTGTGVYYGTGTGASGYPAPTGNSSVPYSPSASPSAFLGAAAPTSVAMGAAAMVAGVATLFLL